MKAPLKISRESGAKYQVTSDSFDLHAEILPAKLLGQPSAVNGLQFETVFRGEGRIGPLSGCIDEDVAVNDGLEYRREIFTSDDRLYCCVRLTVKNRRDVPIELESLFPLAVAGRDALSVQGQGLDQWRFFKTCRQKTDVPGSFDFTSMDENFEDAALEGGKIKAGGGVTGNQEDFLNREEICAEPFFYIKNRNHENRPGIFFGILGQTEHLTTFTIRPDLDKMALNSIRCRCEFDSVRVDPGEERSTHWVMIAACRDEVMMREIFTEILAQEMGVEPPARRPLNIYCTWQFYGFDFCSQDLDENLRVLQEQSLPVDVFQLDNGWMDKLGDYNANHRFPEGMKSVADKIRAAGLVPGIWTCPTMNEGSSDAVKKYPDLICRTRDGKPLKFNYIKGDAYAIDPTAPNYRKYMQEVYSKLLAWGFTYHKTDFLRSIILNENIQFYDRKMNRAQAYRLAGEVLRDVLGEESYIVSCGGINDAANAGVYDSLRTTNDMFGFWTPPDGERWKGTLIKIKQAGIRNYTNRLLRSDPDACPIRRRTEPFRPGVLRDDLSLGLFTDEEAFSVVLNQYTAGGNTCICERLAELDEDRGSLYRHMIPSMGIPARPLDYTTDRCPNYFLTTVVPRAVRLEPWWTLAVGNWQEDECPVEIDLGKCRLPDSVKQVAVFEFHDQEFFGIMDRDACFRVRIPVHGMRLFRLVAWDGETPVLLGTDLHFSGGGVELSEIDISSSRISGRLDTVWKEYPVRVWVAFPSSSGDAEILSTRVNAGETSFQLMQLEEMVAAECVG